MNEVEIIIVNDKKVKCEGESEIIGHPLVYLEMGNEEQVTCPYCSRVFKHQV